MAPEFCALETLVFKSLLPRCSIFNFGTLLICLFWSRVLIIQPAFAYPAQHCPASLQLGRHLCSTSQRFTRHGFTNVRPCYYNNHVASFNIEKLLLKSCVYPNPGPANIHGLNVLYLNARNLKAFVQLDKTLATKVCKISLMQELVYSGSYDVCICETWLSNSVLSSELFQGYSIHRRDRADKRGGSVLVAIKTDIQASRRLDLESENIELVVVEILKGNSNSIILYTFYRPPNSGPEVLLSLNTSLLNTKESTNIVLVGDFNLPSNDWSLDLPATTTTTTTTTFILFLYETVYSI